MVVMVVVKMKVVMNKLLDAVIPFEAEAGSPSFGHVLFIQAYLQVCLYGDHNLMNCSLLVHTLY